MTNTMTSLCLGKKLPVYQEHSQPDCIERWLAIMVIYIYIICDLAMQMHKTRSDWMHGLIILIPQTWRRSMSKPDTTARRAGDLLLCYNAHSQGHNWSFVRTSQPWYRTKYYQNNIEQELKNSEILAMSGVRILSY